MSTRQLAPIDRFAELLSIGLTVPEIRERMGITNNSAQSFMRRIRQGLGWQAS